MKTKARVAVTGIGIVSPLGNTTQRSWDNLLAMQSGIGLIQKFDASTFTSKIAAEVKDFTPSHRVAAKLTKFLVPLTHFALSAAEQAFDDAGIAVTPATSKRWGVVVGCGMMAADYDYWRNFQQNLAPQGEIMYTDFFDKHYIFTPAQFGKTNNNTGLALLSKCFQIEGYANSVHTACASGGQALGLGMQAIRRGEVDYVLAGGFDSMIDPFGVASFCLLGALSTYNDTPASASRPFDYTRNGFVLGEGAAFLILEEWHKAKSRGAKIYAELAGEGNTLSCYRITDSHPSGEGAIQAMQIALNEGGVPVQDVDYINAHGTSTKMNDLSETNAIKVVFGDIAKNIPVSSTKSLTGHLIAAAGALEGAFTAMAIHYGKIPATVNLTTPDPECDLDYVTTGIRDAAIKVALSNSFGFGGSNSCLLFKHPEYRGER